MQSDYDSFEKYTPYMLTPQKKEKKNNEIGIGERKQYRIEESWREEKKEILQMTVCQRFVFHYALPGAFTA